MRITAMGRFSFTTLERFPIRGRGMSHIVELPEGFRCNTDELKDKLTPCIIDNHLVYPVGFETFCTMQQSAGMRVGIVLAE